MLRFIKGSKVTFRLGEIFFDNLSKNIIISKEIAALPIINNYQIKTIPNLMKFCTSITPETQDEPNITEITGGNSELEHKLRVLILEAEVMRQEGKAVPNNSSVSVQNWQEMLELPSRSARRKYLEFLFKVEKKKENRKKKKEQKQLEWEQSPKPTTEIPDVLNYALGYNNFFLRFYDSTINHFYNNRLIQAMQFGQKLIVDCGYDENMNKRENSNCAKQLMLLFAENRMNDEPFDLHYCNASPNTDLMKVLQKFIATMYDPSFPLTIHEKSYMDVFPKEKLVYLTPHCREVMTDFNHDDIYIIGALVDKVNNDPLSLAKAKKEGIRMAKLPLDNYLDWGAGSGKSLTINQVTSILLDIKSSGDWNYALRHVPRRKLAEFNLNTAVKKFNNRLSYVKEPQTDKTWKPNKKKNFDQLSFKSKQSNYEQKQSKSSTGRLVNVKSVVNE